MGKRGKWKVHNSRHTGQLVPIVAEPMQRSWSSALTAKLEPLPDAKREALKSGMWRDMAMTKGSLLEFLQTRRTLQIAMPQPMNFLRAQQLDAYTRVRTLTVTFDCYEPARDAVWLTLTFDGGKANMLVDALRLQQGGDWNELCLQLADEAFNAELADAADDSP